MDAFKCAWLATTVLLSSVAGATAQQPLVEPYLISGKLDEGEQALKKHLAANPADDQSRFGLGVLKFIQSVEHLGRSWYKFGLEREVNTIPFLRLPVPENPNPEKVTYQQARAVIEGMIEYLDQSDQELAKVTSKDVKLPLHLFNFHLDFDQDNKLSPKEEMADIYEEYFGGNFGQGKRLDEIVVVFDYADVQWLRGYSHLIRAMCETILAYDEQELWDVVAHRVFQKAVVPFKFLDEEKQELPRNRERWSIFSDRNAILDLVAAIHQLNFKLQDPDRLQKAHRHLKQTIVQSREMWTAVLAETDDDREWIPNRNQTSVVSLTRITKEMVDTWGELLDEMDAILDGKKLLPFWRGTDKTRGVNLHEVFHKPGDLDIVLWIHGSGAAPFLQNGDVTKPETWDRFQRAYGGQLFTFAAWFN